MNISISPFVNKDLRGENFRYIVLRGADLSYSDLRGAYFRYCDLRGADLSKAIIDATTCFDDAIFDENTKMPDIPMVCPEEGSFIGYKKAINLKFYARYRWTWMPSDSCIVKLLIPDDAKRSSGVGRKCRCDKAKVLEITTIDGEPVEAVASMFTKLFHLQTRRNKERRQL